MCAYHPHPPQETLIQQTGQAVSSSLYLALLPCTQGLLHCAPNPASGEQKDVHQTPSGGEVTPFRTPGSPARVHWKWD